MDQYLGLGVFVAVILAVGAFIYFYKKKSAATTTTVDTGTTAPVNPDKPNPIDEPKPGRPQL